jgi:ADP-ribose pyrophosphatase YjhB (NUDIX family)
MVKAGVLVVKDGLVALMKRRHEGLHYYMFPSGEVLHGEAIVDAAARKMREFGFPVTIQRLIAEALHRTNIHYYFLANLTPDTRYVQQFAPDSQQRSTDQGIYELVWMPIRDLLRGPIYPQCVATVVVQSQYTGWRGGVRRFRT